MSHVKISKILLQINAIKKENIEILSSKTRDNKRLIVYRDKITKVIYIDDFYYSQEKYTNNKNKIFNVANLNFEGLKDNLRRFNAYQQFVSEKLIVDFGCGAGEFLKLSRNHAKSVTGIELQSECVQNLNNEKISCFSDIGKIKEKQDTFFLFHSLEHLHDPINTLIKIRNKLKKNGQGKVIIEVPHANDFLINTLCLKSFIDFTLWSQHLILHTRESLRLMMQYAGFENIIITGIQRYNIANHLNWLLSNSPEGHKEILSVFETQDLIDSYSNALSKIDANDTLVAIANTP